MNYFIIHIMYINCISEIISFRTPVLSDEHSYGFRQGRNVKDAILQLEKYVSKNPKCEWILKADIESCFDNISHEWLLKNVQVYTALLRKFLKAGFIKQNVWYPTDKGVPQGGSVSSILCNLTLDGLEYLLCVHFI